MDKIDSPSKVNEDKKKLPEEKQKKQEPSEENESEKPLNEEDKEEKYERAKAALEKITYEDLWYIDAEFTVVNKEIKAEQFEAHVTPNIYFDDDIKNHSSFDVQRKHSKIMKVDKTLLPVAKSEFIKGMVQYREVCNGYVPYLSARKHLISHVKNNWKTNAFQRLEHIVYDFQSKFSELLAQEEEDTDTPVSEKWSAKDVIAEVYDNIMIIEDAKNKEEDAKDKKKDNKLENCKLIFLVVFWYGFEKKLKKKKKYLLKNFKISDADKDEEDEEEKEETKESSRDPEDDVLVKNEAAPKEDPEEEDDVNSGGSWIGSWFG